MYNIARHETAKIVCELESNPSHDVNFTWKFNTSIAETTDLPASLIAIERSKSVAHYTPTNEQVYIIRRKGNHFMYFVIDMKMIFSVFNIMQIAFK